MCCYFSILQQAFLPLHLWFCSLFNSIFNAQIICPCRFLVHQMYNEINVSLCLNASLSILAPSSPILLSANLFNMKWCIISLFSHTPGRYKKVKELLLFNDSLNILHPSSPTLLSVKVYVRRKEEKGKRWVTKREEWS